MTSRDYRARLGITDPPRTDPSQLTARELYERSLGIGCTSTEQAEARAALAEAEKHPWRHAWPAAERWHRRGQEAELVRLYESRLGESTTAAQAHAHRLLSSAWLTGSTDSAKVLAVREALDREVTRLEAMHALTETTTRPATSTTRRHVLLHEVTRQNRTTR